MKLILNGDVFDFKKDVNERSEWLGSDCKYCIDRYNEISLCRSYKNRGRFLWVYKRKFNILCPMYRLD